ncbi:TonB-dependent receptor [Haliangium sp.]|uniref:TonB-dependent receptor n=1 Tax=Haliangium sp. TaxID=2663208 RepID=UPI003D1526CF
MSNIGTWVGITLVVGGASVGVAQAQEVAAAGTGVVRGTVTDRDTGVPLAGATVLVMGTELGAVSESDGSYVIEGLAPGRYQVQVILYGKPEDPVEVEIAAGQEASLALQASESDFAGEVIVVTGTRSPEKIFDAPVTVESVSEEDLARTAGPTYLSSLANVKGIDFADASLNDQRISMRGFTTQFNSRLITMVDGRLAQLPGNGLPQANNLPSPAIDMKAVEVVVGPASALYGANAHTGVINIISKSPWDESGVRLSLRGGTQNLLDGSVRVAGTVGDSLGWKVNAQAMRAEDFEPDCEVEPLFRYGTDLCETTVVADYEVQSLKGEGSLYYKFGDWMAKASAGYSDNDAISATNAGRNHLRGLTVAYQAAQVSHPNWYAQFTRTATGGGKSYQLNAVVASAAVRAESGGSVAPEDLGALRHSAAFVDDSEMYDGELQYRNTLFGVSGTAGVQWRRYLPDSGGTYLADALGKSLEATEIGGYVQLDYSMMDNRVRLVGAVRVDDNSNYETQASPKAAVVVEPVTGHKVRAGYNRAFKSPTVLESFLYIHNPAGGLNLVGNRTGFEIRDMNGAVVRTIDPLVPEQVDALEVGYKGILGRQVFVDAVFYNSWYDDFIGALALEVLPGGPEMAYYADSGDLVGDGLPGAGSLLTYKNFGQATVRGADVGVDVYPMENLALSAGVSLISLVSDEAEAPALNVPGFKFKSSVTVEDLFAPGSFVRFAGRYSNGFHFASGVWVGDVPPMFVGDLTAGYTLRDLGVTVTGGVMNLFNNKEPAVPGSPIPRPLAFVQLGYAYSGLNL